MFRARARIRVRVSVVVRARVRVRVMRLVSPMEGAACEVSAVHTRGSRSVLLGHPGLPLAHLG